VTATVSVSQRIGRVHGVGPAQTRRSSGRDSARHQHQNQTVRVRKRSTSLRVNGNISRQCRYKSHDSDLKVIRFMWPVWRQTEFKFPKSAKNNQNEMLTIVNQDNISQPITVETCR
jgi:hypothetical protein